MIKQSVLALVFSAALCSSANAQVNQMSNTDKLIVAKRACQMQASGQYTSTEIDNAIDRAIYRPVAISSSDVMNDMNESYRDMLALFDKRDIVKLANKRCGF
jgi:hypothetical protein